VSLLRFSATSSFWKLFAKLPAEVQDLALTKYELFKQNPFHPSLGFQEKGRVWTIESAAPTGPLHSGTKTNSLGFGSEAMRNTTVFLGG
jgi:hypothetical protein